IMRARTATNEAEAASPPTSIEPDIDRKLRAAGVLHHGRGERIQSRRKARCGASRIHAVQTLIAAPNSNIAAKLEGQPDSTLSAVGYARTKSIKGEITCRIASLDTSPDALRTALRNTNTLEKATVTASHRIAEARSRISAFKPARLATMPGIANMSMAT